MRERVRVTRSNTRAHIKLRCNARADDASITRVCVLCGGVVCAESAAMYVILIENKSGAQHSTKGEGAMSTHRLSCEVYTRQAITVFLSSSLDTILEVDYACPINGTTWRAGLSVKWVFGS